MEDPPSLVTFVTVAETLSFAAAARRLGLSPSATGKAIATLEAQLGVRLFTRTTRRVSLTPEGELLLGRARRLQDDWRETTALLSASASEPQGLLRISLPAAGYRFLAPHLAAFAQTHPKIRLDLDFDDRIRDLVTEGFDLAIRSGALPDSGLMSRRLPPFRLSVYAAPSYLAECGEPADHAALSGHRLIRFRHPDTDVLQAWQLASGAQAAIEEATPHVICSNIEAVRAAAVAGLGLAWAPDFLMRDALETGQLQIVLPQETIEAAFWMLWPSGRYGSTRLRAFIDFAASHLFAA
ncbi:LysR substrate-binding domain-containing protein [Bradyrhizobium sp. C9]|uniref:LysR substrate-binding domain-containing protein n=1 Tax=Bradyrhizobium sp. C9 TaxID=142585 RepID=UPI000BE9EBD0|nr:LysR substrate-binding domain-containing protein [Bradyrhizobium sp. C9]PDT77039.1 LysR family transcriptional regulator [Bradyrhizobium sp. C9]